MAAAQDPPEEKVLAREVKACDWIFDLFAFGFDHVETYLTFPAEDSGRVWNEFCREKESAAGLDLAGCIVGADGGVPNEVLEYLDIPKTSHEMKSRPFLWRLHFVLQAIDRASCSLNYFVYQEAGTWVRVNQYMTSRRGFLNKGDRQVTLLPPRKFPPFGEAAEEPEGPPWWDKQETLEEIKTRGENYASRCENLCRVPKIDGCIINIVKRPFLLSCEWSQLKIGVVPLIESLEVKDGRGNLLPGPLQIAQGPGNQLEMVFRDPTRKEEDCAPLCDRAAEAIRYMSQEKAQIVVFPELVVPNPVLKRIQAELKTLAAAGRFLPALVVAGTFLRPRGGGMGNTAVVLNGMGQVVWRQSKMQPYTMQVHEQKKYGLESLFQGDATEDIQYTPRELTFYDSPLHGLRAVVAICEDLTQNSPCLNAIRAMRPNLVLTPVMAGPLLTDLGFGTPVSGLARDPGCMTVVANSAGLARANWHLESKDGEPPLALVGLPLLDSAAGFTTTKALDQVFRLEGTGVEVIVFSVPDYKEPDGPE